MNEYIEKPDMQYILHIKCDKNVEKRLIDFCLESVVDVFEDTGLTADVQPVKHGKWEQLVSKQSGLNYEVGARCSCCNEHTVTICICEAMPFEFCPHCGARMDGDAE